MLFGKLAKSIFVFLVFPMGLFSQVNRDEVVQITYPYTGAIIDTDSVAVTFNIASFFTLGTPGCNDCDGYLKAYLDNTLVVDSIVSSPFTLSGLSDGQHFLNLEAVDPSGNSFTPVVHDTVSFTVDVPSVDNYCPPRAFSLMAGDTRNYLYWEPPFGVSGANPFPATPNSADYHTGTTDGSSLIQTSLIQAHGGSTTNRESGWIRFSLLGMSANVAIDSIVFNYYVNATNWPYWSATAVSVDPLTASPATLHSEINAGSSSSEAYLYRNESSSFSPGWYSYPLVNNAAADLLAAIPQGWFVVGIMDRDGSASYYLDLDGWNEANPPSLDIYWSAPGGGGVFRAPPIGDLPYTYEEVELYKTATQAGQPVPPELAAIQGYEMESHPLQSREVIEGCGDLQNYGIYLSDGTMVDTTDTTFYIHENLTNGTEYCYYIVANYTGAASVPTDTLCATPEAFIPPPITNLSGVGLDEEIALSWTDPWVPQYAFYENFNSGMPLTWTITDNNNSGIIWDVGEDGPSGYTLDDFDETFAIIISYSNTFPNSDLISPPIDLSAFTDATLYYTFNYQDYAGNPTDSGNVYISGDGGATWTLMQSYTVDTPPGGLNAVLSDSVSLSSVAGSSDVRIKFHYHVDSGESWFFAVDDIIVIGSGTATSRDLTGSTVSTNDMYIPGNTHLMNFTLTVVAPDFAYCDSFAVTFPAGVTINAAGPDALGIGGEPYGPEPFNGIQGQTISWGTNANDAAGGIFGTLTFWAELTFADSLSGPLPVQYHFSDDWWSTPVDVDGTFFIEERILTDGDLLGYNVYVDSSSTPDNTSVIGNTSYLVTGLNNGQNYTLGVTAVYYPSYESEQVTITLSPTWLYGDISGVIYDPNGATLDSAIVSAGSLTDTTGADGVYLLPSLLPGEYTVRVIRAGFEMDETTVTVVAQEAPTVQDFTLTPKVGRPVGLEATGGDYTVHLLWKNPGAEQNYDLAYYDDVLESQIGCGGGCEFGVRFTPLGYPATLQSVLISTQGDAAVTSGNLVAYLDPNGSIMGPGGLTGVVLATGLNLPSNGGVLTQYLVDVSAANLVINSGDVYLMIEENSSGFLGIANDIDPQSPEFYDRNWVYTGGVYSTIYDAVDGDPSLTGDFGLLATFFGAAGRQTLDGNGHLVETLEIVHQGTYHGELKTKSVMPPVDEENYVYSENPENVTRLAEPILPNRTVVSREDSLVGFNVYQVLSSGDTLVATTTGDTTATIIVPENYVEYCYNVKAIWQTDNYGQLESKPSGEACAIPYTAGDVDFDSDVDLTDLLTVVDFVLQVTVPTDPQIRGADVNQDGEINIQDIVLIVDIIYGVNARQVAFDPSAVLSVELTALENASVGLSFDYDSYLQGLEFTLTYNPQEITLGVPNLTQPQKNLIVSSHDDGAGKVTIVVYHSGGGVLDLNTETYLSVPVQKASGTRSQGRVILDRFLAAGEHGVAVPVLRRTTSVEIKLLPTQFALHQNYPNPFNPVTEITFDVPMEGLVELVVYNLRGQEVRRLVSGTLPAGYHRILWNGQNDAGEEVSTGIYFYRLTARYFHDTKKMVLVK